VDSGVGEAAVVGESAIVGVVGAVDVFGAVGGGACGITEVGVDTFGGRGELAMVVFCSQPQNGNVSAARDVFNAVSFNETSPPATRPVQGEDTAPLSRLVQSIWRSVVLSSQFTLVHDLHDLELIFTSCLRRSASCSYDTVPVRPFE
jgi:hypothetical protein